MSQNEGKNTPVKEKKEDSPKKLPESLTKNEKEVISSKKSPEISPVKAKLNYSPKKSPESSPIKEKKYSLEESLTINEIESISPKKSPQILRINELKNQIVSEQQQQQQPPEIPITERPQSPEKQTEKPRNLSCLESSSSDDSWPRKPPPPVSKSFENNNKHMRFKFADDDSNDWVSARSMQSSLEKKLNFPGIDDSIKSSTSGGKAKSASVDENPIIDESTVQQTPMTTIQSPLGINKENSSEIFEYDSQNGKYVTMYTYKVPITDINTQEKQLIEPKVISKNKRRQKTPIATRYLTFIGNMDDFFHRQFKISGLSVSLKSCCGVFLTFFILLCLPVVKLILSVMNIHSCPATTKIPLWLLCYSLILLIYGFFSLIEKYINTNCRCDLFSMTSLWTAYGTIILFSLFLGQSKISMDKSSEVYCSTFTFVWYCVTIFFSWIVIALIIIYQCVKISLEL